MPLTFKDFVASSLDQVESIYLKDLEAMTEEQLATPQNGKARTPYDFTYEIAETNNHIANRIATGQETPWPFKGWATAPPELQSKQAAVSHFKTSVQNLRDAVSPLTEEELTQKFVPEGREKETSKAELAHFCALHMAYHDAQLNFIQSLDGDLEMHW